MNQLITFKTFKMKYKKLFFQQTALSLLIFFIAFFHPFAYTLNAIDPATGKARAKLEQSTATIQKGKGKNSTESVYNISGIKSSVQLKISEAVFQSVSDQSALRMNPADYISLYKLTAEKNNRSFTINTASLISTTFTSLDYGYYRIVPSQGLIPGEYAFVDKSTTTADGDFTVWTFGVQ